jgi:biopolymer transport protein ExbB/TolQ
MEFDLVAKLLNLTLLGTEWVLWLLILLSVLSVAVMIERFIYFVFYREDIYAFSQKIIDYLKKEDVKGCLEFVQKSKSFEAEVVLAGIENYDKKPKAIAESMNAVIIGKRYKLDRGLIVLGTLGNNTPFIGLFGTVLGIIQAFNDLSLNPAGGPSVVMSGISEALVATAVGLLVAIPAVVAFNVFNRIVKRIIQNAEFLSKAIANLKQS